MPDTYTWGADSQSDGRDIGGDSNGRNAGTAACSGILLRHQALQRVGRERRSRELSAGNYTPPRDVGRRDCHESSVCHGGDRMIRDKLHLGLGRRSDSLTDDDPIRLGPCCGRLGCGYDLGDHDGLVICHCRSRLGEGHSVGCNSDDQVGRAVRNSLRAELPERCRTRYQSQVIPSLDFLLPFKHLLLREHTADAWWRQASKPQMTEKAFMVAVLGRQCCLWCIGNKRVTAQ